MIQFPKIPRFTRHDAETAGVVFGAGFLASLSQSDSLTRAAILAALSAGLTAVVHRFLKPPKD